MSPRHVVGLDLGSQTVRCAVAEAAPGRIRVLGVGEAPSAGVARGMVVDPASASEAIAAAVAAAERVSGVEIDQVVVGLGGAHLRSEARRATVRVLARDGRVGPGDVRRALDQARTGAAGDGRESLHLIPHAYTLDGGAPLPDPVGQAGERLDLAATLVTAAVPATTALVDAVHAAGLAVEDVVAGGLAAAEGVLRDVELERGVAVVDCGAATTTVVVLAGGAVVHLAVLPVGGQHVSQDLAVGLRCDRDQAESLKCRHGTADTLAAAGNELVTLTGPGVLGPHEVPRRQLSEIIEPRVREIARLVGAELERSASGAVARLVLSGGGSCLSGLPMVVHRLLEAPVRVAVPEGLAGLEAQLGHPGHAALAGLLHWGSRQDQRRERQNRRSTGSAGRLNRWLHDLF
ncbi:MAG TPA: cell division protein FtsA [Candidatus Micrarchaeia archaeon]|nr:cell division protein FtsA [Candidatus Micrarchaeia archaeon]